MTRTRLGPRGDQIRGIRIRLGRQADVPALIALSKRTLRGCYAPFLGKKSVQAWIATVLDSYVCEHVEGAWLATTGGAVCGYCVVKGPLLDLLLVDVREQGRGIGTLLLRHAEKILARSYTEIRLESFAANAPANAFYSRRGWMEGDRHHDVESALDMLTFRKRVSELATPT